MVLPGVSRPIPTRAGRALALVALIALPWAGRGTPGPAAAQGDQGGEVAPAGIIEFPYIVNSTGDGANTRGTSCDDGTGKCTLRAAIQAANSAPSHSNIQFSIPGTDPGCSGGSCTINLTQALPDLSTDMSISGPGPNLLTVRRNSGGSYGIFRVTATGTVSLSGLTIANGATGAGNFRGGGVLNLSGGTVNVTNSTISGNSGVYGGITNLQGLQNGTMMVINSKLTGNHISTYGGAILNGGGVTVINSTIDDNEADDGGGGIANFGTLTVNGSTISRNRAQSRAGGIFDATSSSTANISNSTISGNIVQDGGAGGIEANGTVNVNDSTITGNSATFGGGFSRTGGTTTVKNSIIALNTAGFEPDVRSAFTSNGYNLIGKTDGSTGFTMPTDQTGTVAAPLDPRLDPNGLQDNGGLTLTHALLCGSPALDRGSSSMTTDQRGVGFPRTFDDPAVVNAVGGVGTDIGAFEVQQACPPPTPTPTVTSTATPASTQTFTPTVTVTATATLTPTASPTATTTPSLTVTGTPPNTNTVTATATATPTATRTATAAPPVATSTVVGGVTGTPTAPTKHSRGIPS